MLSPLLAQRHTAREHARLLISDSLSKAVPSANSTAIATYAKMLHKALMAALDPCLKRLFTIAKMTNGDRKYDNEGAPFLSLSSSLQQFLVGALELKMSLESHSSATHRFHWVDHGQDLNLETMTTTHAPGQSEKHSVALTLFPGLSVRLARRKDTDVVWEEIIVAPTHVASYHRSE